MNNQDEMIPVIVIDSLGMTAVTDVPMVPRSSFKWPENLPRGISFEEAGAMLKEVNRKVPPDLSVDQLMAMLPKGPQLQPGRPRTFLDFFGSSRD